MYPINSRLYTMFFLKLFKGCFFSPSQRQLTLVKNLGRHFRASVVENHQGPVAHWDVGNPAAPVSPKGDDQRRAFLTFTEVWGPGEFEGGLFFWGNFVFLMLFMRVCWWALSFFVDVYNVHWVLLGWGLLGVLWEVLLVGLFRDVLWLLSFFCHVHCMYTLATDTAAFLSNFVGGRKNGGFGCMISQPFPFLTSMSQSCNVTIPAPCRPNVCPVHWQNWAVLKQWSIFARRYSNGHQKWSGYIRSNNHSHLIFTPLEKDLKHLWYIVKATIVLVLAVFYINPFAEDVLVVCRSKLGLYCTCKIPKIAQEKNRNGVDLDISHVHCFLLGNVSASGRLPGQGECGTHEECPRWRTEGPVLVSNWNHGNLWRSTPFPLQCHPLLWK